MKRLCFKDYNGFVHEVNDKFDLIKDLDEFGDISIVAKYYDAKEIIKELVKFNYDIATLHIANEESEGYKNEYIISIDNLNDNKEIWCEPMKYESTYIDDYSAIIYIMDNCSSACIKHCKAKVLFEVAVSEDDNCECNCDVCCHDEFCEFDECCEVCECDCNECCECDEDNVECTVKPDDERYSITVRCNLDADEAMEMIKDMENRMEHMNDMFRKMDEWRKLFRW